MQEMADIFGKTAKSFEDVKSSMVKLITDNSLNHLELGFEKALRHVDRFHLAPIQASLALSHIIVSIHGPSNVSSYWSPLCSR